MIKQCKRPSFKSGRVVSLKTQRYCFLSVGTFSQICFVSVCAVIFSFWIGNNVPLASKKTPKRLLHMRSERSTDADESERWLICVRNWHDEQENCQSCCIWEFLFSSVPCPERCRQTEAAKDPSLSVRSSWGELLSDISSPTAPASSR